MTAVFVKPYANAHRADAARAHWTWLDGLDSGVRLPTLRSASTRLLEFEHLGDRQPGLDDLAMLAEALGRMHAAAYAGHLHGAQLDVPFIAADGLRITDFVTPRRRLLDQLPVPWIGLPAAIYKDANIRNFLLVDTNTALGTGASVEVAIIDFDDLTLAPFGYDLAKLIVSAAMTHGHIDDLVVDSALEAYNTTTRDGTHDGVVCSRDHLRRYAEFHHLCTQPYLHRNGYHHAWPTVRPWPEPSRW